MVIFTHIFADGKKGGWKVVLPKNRQAMLEEVLKAIIESKGNRIGCCENLRKRDDVYA